MMLLYSASKLAMLAEVGKGKLKTWLKNIVGLCRREIQKIYVDL